jgi:hypothetical protein
VSNVGATEGRRGEGGGSKGTLLAAAAATEGRGIFVSQDENCSIGRMRLAVTATVQEGERVRVRVNV